MAYELTQLTADYSLGRLVPSRGLTIGQVSEMFSQFGFAPEIYFRSSFVNKFPHDPTLFERLLYYYVESGLPVVASLPRREHALTIFGHVSDYTKVLPACGPADSYSYVGGLVVNDDNHMPYQIVARAASNVAQHPQGFTVDDVEAFVVPLYEKIHLLAEHVEKWTHAILKNSVIGLAAVGSALTLDQTVLRIFLTTARSYKRERMHAVPAPHNLSRLYASWQMPRFIWVVELSTKDLYRDGKVAGEIIMDATANLHDPWAFIAVHYPELLILNDRHSLSEGIDRLTAQNLPSFEAYDVYRHNLKEVPQPVTGGLP